MEEQQTTPDILKEDVTSTFCLPTPSHTPLHTSSSPSTTTASPSSRKKGDLSFITDALKANRDYQAILQRKLEQIINLQEKNAYLQSKLQHFASIASVGPFFSTKVNDVPCFVDQENKRPPENDDVIKRRSFPALMTKEKKWSRKESQILARAVRTENRRILFEKVLASNGGDFDKAADEVNRTLEKDLELNLTGLDWEKISRMVSSRPPLECAIRWTGLYHPLINKTEWSGDEVERLKKMVAKYNERNWPQIAIDLGTNRTAAQCFKYFKRIISPNFDRRKWTEEDDNILKRAVQFYGERNWQQVAHCLDGRTGQQCLHRWAKTLTPYIRKGRWTVEEDKALIAATKLYNVGNWIKIQQHVPGRTDVQCRERYMNILDPSIHRTKWTMEEDERLLELVEKFGCGKWSEIVKYLPGRTDNQCWRRWKSLKNSETFFKKFLKKRKRKSDLPNEAPSSIIDDIKVCSPPKTSDPEDHEEPSEKKSTGNENCVDKSKSIKKRCTNNKRKARTRKT